MEEDQLNPSLSPSGGSGITKLFAKLARHGIESGTTKASQRHIDLRNLRRTVRLYEILLGEDVAAKQVRQTISHVLDICAPSWNHSRIISAYRWRMRASIPVVS